MTDKVLATYEGQQEIAEAMNSYIELLDARISNAILKEQIKEDEK